MSTKAIREALAIARSAAHDTGHSTDHVDAAEAEVEAIEKAARQWYAQETQGLVLVSYALAPLERIALDTRRDDVTKREEA